MNFTENGLQRVVGYEGVMRGFVWHTVLATPEWQRRPAFEHFRILKMNPLFLISQMYMVVITVK